MTQEEIIALIKREVKPALGCTEPIAVALAVAKAVEIISENCTCGGDWRLKADFRLDIRGFLTGSRLTSGSTRPEYRLAPWTTWDASLQWTRKAVRLSLDVRNLFNQQYQVVLKYPMPGIHLLGSVAITL